MRLAKIVAILYATMNLSGCGVEVETPLSPGHLNTSFDYNKAPYVRAAEGMADCEKIKTDYLQYNADKDFFSLYSKELNERKSKEYPISNESSDYKR
jgi:hypothetical protein